MLNKSHLLSKYVINSGKNKKNVWCILTLMLVSLPLAMAQDTTLRQFFFCNLYLFDSIFSVIVRTNRLHNFCWRNVFPWKLLLWKWVKDIFTVIIATNRKKMLHSVVPCQIIHGIWLIPCGFFLNFYQW